MHLSYYQACLDIFKFVWCRSKKEQQNTERGECVSGIKMCVHAHFNFVNFSLSSSFLEWCSHGNDGAWEIKKSTLDPSFAVFLCCNVIVWVYLLISAAPWVARGKKIKEGRDRVKQVKWMLFFMHAVPSSIIQ